MNIDISELSNAIVEELENYSHEIADKIDTIIEEIGKEAVKRIKQISPKQYGKYAKGWRYKVAYSGRGNRRIVLHNKIYQLTHLLEDGHQNRDGSRTSPIPHISTIEEWANNELDKRIKELEQ